MKAERTKTEGWLFPDAFTSKNITKANAKFISADWQQKKDDPEKKYIMYQFSVDGIGMSVSMVTQYSVNVNALMDAWGEDTSTWTNKDCILTLDGDRFVATPL